MPSIRDDTAVTLVGRPFHAASTARIEALEHLAREIEQPIQAPTCRPSIGMLVAVP